MASRKIESTSNGPDQAILLVGVGEAGKTHLEVLEQIPSLSVVATVDTNASRSVTFRNRNLPVYKSTLEASRRHDPDVVVIATPTHTHAQLCDEVIKNFPALTILVEKPAADDIIDAQRLLDGRGGTVPVNVALHMAFAPEVCWGANLVRARISDLGVPISIQSWSGDPHQSDLVSAESRFGTSWIDSGINSLSVIERFARTIGRRSLRRLGQPSHSTFEGIFTCESETGQVEATVLTSWNVTDSTRSTRVRYSSGAEVVMDHHAVAGYLIEDSRVTEVFGSDGSIPRRASHYKALYQWWLVDNNPIFLPETTLRLHNLLLESIDDI
jgi:predicted dehydrogenase